MSNEQKNSKRWIGKIKNITTKFGVMQKIYMENTEHLGKDGQPNPYYKGAMVWYDADGTAYKVKQMSITIPKDGMPAELVQKGFSCYVTLTLDDDYEVQILK